MIVGFAGYAQVGKDTAASTIAAEYNRLSFAAELRAFVYELNPLLTYGKGTEEECHLTYQQALDAQSYEWAKAHTDLRDFMVKLGAGIRALAPDAWIRPVSLRILGREDGLSVITVSDVRYANEARHLMRQHGARIFYIERPGYGPANEEEERSIREMIYQIPVTTIVNDGTKEDLGKKVRDALV
jgi:hypothetical protein